MSNEPILRVEELTKSFGGVVAVHRVSFDLYPGEAMGVIGPNGSGKTTLINLITGFVKPDSGRVVFKGKDITKLAPQKIANMGIGRTFQIMRPFYSVPAYRNLVVPLFSRRARKFAEAGQLGDRDVVAIDILEDVGFERDAHVPYKPASALPLGYLKRLELARCIALKSEVMLCDEVFSGLSAAEISSLSPLMERLNMEGATLLMIEHRLSELFKVVNRIMVINFGVKIYEGKPEEALENEGVREAYFGKKKEGMI
jgi:branched-chain amino acid transport system ATP-binding protein